MKFLPFSLSLFVLFVSSWFNRFQASKEGSACDAAFVVEQPAFDVDAPSVARQAAVTAEDAVARHDDREGIARDRAANCLRSARLAKNTGEIAV